eukprot:TRINITY_DN1516_c2_g2_i1.p1 TRINITY_DN1516_c2_g2~~TRINITY_DN1516_c2_g2_i1.p1  ORF type:complete len:100 (-),score=29.62 TRINITY_DN1516_c2_g2_i1:164-427(-)
MTCNTFFSKKNILLEEKKVKLFERIKKIGKLTVDRRVEGKQASTPMSGMEKKKRKKNQVGSALPMCPATPPLPKKEKKSYFWVLSCT